MKKKQYFPIILIFSIAIALWFLYPHKTEYKKITGFTQGTTYHITYQDRPDRELRNEIESLLHEFDLSLSTYIPESVISKVNRNEKVEIDKYFKTVFNKGKEIYSKTNGAFDMTVAPVVNAWGFGAQKKIYVDSTIIDSLMNYVGFDKIELTDKTIVKNNPNVQLDVNAIAQGYSVDIVAQFLEKKGISNYMVEIGGEVKTKGVNPNEEIWKIGIDRPIEGSQIPGEDLQAVIKLKNRSLATSGNYRKFYERNGIKFVHTIDPTTGYPIISRLLSATVIAKDCMSADAYATAFMVMGLEKSIEFLSNQDILDAYLIYGNEEGQFETYATQGIEKAIFKEVKH